MSKLARLAALAAIAALSACAPVNVAVVPATAYDAVAAAELNATETKMVEKLRAAVAEKKLALEITVDGSAMAAARMLVNRRADAKGVLPSEARNILQEAGIADVGARWTANSVGYNDLAADPSAILDDLGAFGGALHVGVCDLPDPMHNRRVWAAVVVPRIVSLDGVPRQSAPGAKLALSGKAHDAVTDARLELLKPDGTVERQDLKPGSDKAFSLSLEMPSAPGIYVVGVTARFKGAERPLLAAPVSVGAAPTPWPTRAADLEVKDEKGLEQSLAKVLGDVRGKPLAEAKALSDSARACVTALTEDKECAMQGARMLVWDVASSSVERFVSEIVASPATRALWNSDGAAVAAAKTKAGQFVVVTAFGAASSAPAPAPEPTPSPAPEPAPAATPAPAPAAAPAPAVEPAPAPAAPAPAPAAAP
ncbi:MAG TPA: hypothetical protein VGK67_32355 [Myxococcales bacterium]|jgi:hypothetical protein